MTKIIGFALLLLSLLWFYIAFKYQDKSKNYRWYAIQRDLFGAITLLIIGLYILYKL